MDDEREGASKGSPADEASQSTGGATATPPTMATSWAVASRRYGSKVEGRPLTKDEEMEAAFDILIRASANDLNEFLYLEGEKITGDQRLAIPLEDVLAATRFWMRTDENFLDPDDFTDEEILVDAEYLKGQMMEEWWFFHLDAQTKSPEERARLIAFIESKLHRPMLFEPKWPPVESEDPKKP